MIAIEPHISDYIDLAIERERKIFDANAERHMGMLLERFQDSLRAATEQLLTREEARKMIRDEVRNEVRKEVQAEVRPIRTEIAVFKDELVKLRKTSGSHDIRITRLERKAA